jgi:hypothetical protein
MKKRVKESGKERNNDRTMKEDKKEGRMDS